jgi:Lrp/AsnC family transcriptional regulator, leucine-responsive regulatory protein
MDKLDAFDLKIIQALTENGRISWRDLAAQIGLSFSPTLRRVRRLEEDEVIQGYSVRVDESRLMGAMGVFISVTLERQVKDVLSKFEAIVAALPEIIGGFLISGSHDYMLHGAVRDLDHYQKLLDCLTTIPGVARIQSSFVVKTFVRRTAPLMTPGNLGRPAKRRALPQNQPAGLTQENCRRGEGGVLSGK